MKTTLVRLSVLTLALTGFAASSLASQGHKISPKASTTHQMVMPSPSPMCKPDGSQGYCGMD